MPQQEPDWGSDSPDWTNSLALYYHYKTFPPSILTRLMVRTHESLDRGYCWRRGFMLRFDPDPNSPTSGNRAVIWADRRQPILHLRIQGNPANRRGLLIAINQQLQLIHRSFPTHQPPPKVPQPGDPDPSVSYDRLLKLERQGRTEYYPEALEDELDQPFNVTQLLDGVGRNLSMGGLDDRARRALAQDLITELQPLIQTFTATSPAQQQIAQQQIEREIAQNPSLRQRLINAAIAGGETAIDELVENPWIKVALSVAQGWQGGGGSA